MRYGTRQFKPKLESLSNVVDVFLKSQLLELSTLNISVLEWYF